MLEELYLKWIKKIMFLMGPFAIDLPYTEDKNILTINTWSEIERYSVCREQKMSN